MDTKLDFSVFFNLKNLQLMATSILPDIWNIKLPSSLETLYLKQHHFFLESRTDKKRINHLIGHIKNLRELDLSYYVIPELAQILDKIGHISLVNIGNLKCSLQRLKLRLRIRGNINFLKDFESLKLVELLKFTCTNSNEDINRILPRLKETLSIRLEELILVGR